MRRAALKKIRLFLRGDCWLMLVLLWVSILLRLFPLVSFLVKPVVVVNTVLAVVLIVVWLIWYRCPNCKKLLPLGGCMDEGRMCHHCGEHYR